MYSFCSYKAESDEGDDGEEEDEDQDEDGDKDEDGLEVSLLTQIHPGSVISTVLRSWTCPCHCTLQPLKAA